MGCAYKMSSLSVAHCPRVPNLVPNICLGTTTLPNDKICKLANYLIHTY